MTSFQMYTNDVDEGEEGEGEEESSWWTMSRTATIFLIDAAKEMFDVHGQEEEESPFRRAMKAMHATMIDKAVRKSYDQVGVVFFNTHTNNNKFNYPSVHTIQELQRPSADSILAMEEIIQMSQPQFDAKFGHSDKASIHDALRTCQSVFMGCLGVASRVKSHGNRCLCDLCAKGEKKQIGRSILLFTCRDDPHGQDEQRRRQAEAKGKDLRESHITLEILPMGKAFDVGKFYKDLVFGDGEFEESDRLSQEQRALADPTTCLNQLLERIANIQNKPRPYGNVTFTLQPGVEMAVGVYSVCRKSARPGKQKLYSRNNQEVKPMRKAYLEDTGELLFPSDYGYSQTYSGRKIWVTANQKRSLSNLYNPGIVLLGFVSKSFLQTEYYVKEPSFIYPKDSVREGSSKIFAALLERCLAMEKVPIVRFVARSYSVARMAALIPQTQVLDEDGTQVQPDGFLVYPLPYADDFRNVTIEQTRVASDDKVDAFKKVVNKLSFDYSPKDIDNPRLATHWQVIKELALNCQHHETVPDRTVPDNKKIQSLAGHSLREFKNLVYPPSYDPLQKRKPVPRPGKAPKTPVDPSQVDVEAIVKKGQGNSLTVPVLKAWLTKRGVVVTGKKKAELLQDAVDAVG